MNFQHRFLLCLGLCSFLGEAHAQYPYNVYGNRGYGFGPGAVMQGQADVMNAYGNYTIQVEQARQAREVAEQAKLDTKKKAIDTRLYEKALTPTYGETAARDQARFLKRIMTTPQEAEITGGTAQNTMLPFLNNLVQEGVSGPPAMLDPQMMKFINTSVGSGGANIGLFRDGGKLSWPLALRGPTQKKLADSIPKAVQAAADDTLDVALYNEVAKGVAKLSDELRTKFHQEQIDGGMYLESKRFMDSLDSAVKALRQPTASKMLAGSLGAQGRTVPELVQNMTRQGLKFAPASPGNEAPYFALYASMVSYGNSAMDTYAYKNQFAPTNLDMQYLDKSLKVRGLSSGK